MYDVFRSHDNLINRTDLTPQDHDCNDNNNDQGDSRNNYQEKDQGGGCLVHIAAVQ